MHLLLLLFFLADESEEGNDSQGIVRGNRGRGESTYLFKVPMKRNFFLTYSKEVSK